MPRFRIRHQGSTFELPSGVFTIGRSTSCHLSLDDGLVSRSHASLTVNDSGIVLRDLGSRNGVLLNGVKVEAPTSVKHDDRISIGSAEIVVTEVGRDIAEQGIRCIACEKPMPPGATKCPHCGARTRQFGATMSKITREISEPLPPPPPKPGRTSSGRSTMQGSEEETKHQVITLEFIARIADKALGLGKLEEAERILGSSMDLLIERREAMPPERLRLGTKYALDFAEGLNRPKWLDWVFKAHQYCACVPEAAVVDRLYQLVRKVKPYDARALRAYLETMSRSEAQLSPADRFLLRRLEGLERVIGA